MKMKEIGSADAHTNIPHTFIGIIEVTILYIYASYFPLMTECEQRYQFVN